MKFLVLGGGISGLSAAWYLSRRCPGAEILLLEKSSRLGGRIETLKHDEFLFEKGPRTFSASRSPALLQMIADLGLASELLFSLPSAKCRYLWHRGKLKSVGALFLPHAWRLFLEPFQPKGGGDETIRSFAARRFGEKIADLFFDPMTLGIYAGDFSQLSIQACFPKLFEMEQRHGSIVWAMLRSKKQKNRFPGALFTLRKGMQSLVDALQRQANAKILLNTEVVSLQKKSRGWEVNGSLFADAVFSALDAEALRKLLPSMPSFSSLSLHVVNLGFQEMLMPKNGYGYLVPSREREALLGMIWDSKVFGGPCRMTAMIRSDTKDPEGVALDALKRHLGIENPPDLCRSCLAREAVPQLEPGCKEQLLSWEESLQDLYLSGNFMEGPSVDSCIARSKKMVNLFFQKKFAN